jgi:TonB family protein
MTDDNERTTGWEDRELEEAAVLKFLDKAIAAVRPVREVKEQPSELDTLVSDLLKQVISESDQPQVDGKTASEAAVDVPLHDMSPEMGASFSEDENVLPDQEAQLRQFEDSMSPFAEFMPHLSETPTAKDENEEMQSLPKLQPSMFDDRDDLLARFMFPQEESPSEKSRHEQFDIGIQASRFEGMDDMLAEFMAPQEEPPYPKAKIVPFNPKPEAAQSEPPAAPPAPLMAPAENAPHAENKKASLKPDPEAGQRESHLSASGLQKREVSVKKPEIKSPIATTLPVQKISATRVVPIKTTAKPAPPVYAARIARRGKSLLIAAACICLLAALAVPAYFITGSSSHGSKASELRSPLAAPSQAADSQAAVNGQVPAMPISQLSPKYPQSAVKKQASGSVVLDLDINSEGKVVKATPVSGPEIFHDEVIRTVMKWRYRPASIAGADVASRDRVTFNFHLR